MIQSISNNFGIDVPVKLSFSTMKNAKDFFYRNVLSIENDTHIFQFNYIKAIEHLETTEEEPSNNIRLTFPEIESAFDQTYLNDAILSFAMMGLVRKQAYLDSLI